MRQVYIGVLPCIIMVSNTTFGERISRNPFRARKKSGRSRTNWLDSMTPQGQAVWCNEFVENSYGYVSSNYRDDMYAYLKEKAKIEAHNI